MRPHEPLDYFLTRRGVGTWAQVRTLIQREQVIINDVICKHYHRALQPSDKIVVQGQHIIDDVDAGILICHKSNGVACSHDPLDAPLIYDQLPENFKHPNLQTVGRLDRDTTGLLLLTIDGLWAQRVVAPENKCWKRYRIRFSGLLVADATQRVQAGLLDADNNAYLPGYLFFCQPAGQALGYATIIICEGRYHQVKRMIKILGGQVEQLHRDRIGGLTLPTDLAADACRPLRIDEQQQLLEPQLNDPRTWNDT